MHDLPAADLAAVLRAAFEGVFELRASEVTTLDERAAAVSSALVAITGAWSGAVIVDVPRGFAAELAARRFRVELARIGDGHIAEALADLANRIGGDLEALLGPPCRSSLPTSLEHRDPEAALPGTAIVRDLCFAVDLPAGSGRFRVLVAERDAAVAPRLEAA